MLLDAPFLKIARKEIFIFFSSPIAFVFLATFLAVNLFIFFWVESFFARNIADVRPLFEWMPLLMIFLVAALTMRMWSEEKRMGTLEFVLTVPINPAQFVAGKCLACLTLIALALLLTLPIPMTVAYLGQLDWGPVIGAYIATLCLSLAYIAIGLFVSAKTDSQIVSLIITTLICFVFYLIGSDTITSELGETAGQFFQSISTQTRFDSITRGVIDFRDIYYYFSVFGIFIALNLFSLEKMRWSDGPKMVESETRRYRSTWHSIVFLTIGNFILGNLWLAPVNQLRADLTEGHIYSISSATDSYLSRLQEPLLIRGYFSQKTHPLLSPLVPQLKDLIKEYEVAGEGQVKVEFIDPVTNPELEDEANTKYGIKPVPFQISDKYQASLVNAYFDVLIQYGDQYEVLNFQDLIEVKQLNETELDVKLRNPEYDLTRTIKKALYGFQSTGDLFATIQEPIKFTGYISADDTLPEALRDFKSAINDVLKETQNAANAQGGSTFEIAFKDPNQDPNLAQTLLDQFGFRPMTTSLFSNNNFYFYLTLENGEQVFQISLPEDLEPEAFKRHLEASLKRFSSGFTKVVTLVLPESDPSQFSPHPGQGAVSFQFLEDTLEAEYSIERDQLSSGYVPADTDILVVLSPKDLDDNQVFAIDQYLMKGGTVILATAPFDTEMSRTSLIAKKHTSGIEDWLSHHGIELKPSLILDPQNVPFPIPVTRQVGGFQFQEMRQLDYPYFIDVRPPGLNEDSSIVGGLPQVTVSWASPIEINALDSQTVEHLMHSSADAWLSDSLNILPNLTNDRHSGFTPQGERQSWPIASAIEGRFISYFQGKSSPAYITAANQAPEDDTADADTTSDDDAAADIGVIDQVIDVSPESARLLVFASNQFLTDQALQLLSSTERTLYQNSLQLIQNAIDWSLEDRELLSIRSRGHFSRTLPNLKIGEQQFWERANYAFMILGLGLLFGLYQLRLKARKRQHQAMINTQASA